jgi:perosamine synthetase
MDVNQIEDKITARTKAVMVVHIYGLPVDMDPVIKIADKYGLKIIEDAAEAHGLEYKGTSSALQTGQHRCTTNADLQASTPASHGKKCGSYGDISTFSFYPNKHVTTGEGGMILTDDENLANKCASLRNLCFLQEKRFVHEEMGWNLRMSNLQAAVGVAQLERLDEFVSKKKAMGKKYTELLNDIKEIQLPVAKTDYAENIYWIYGLILNKELPFDAAEAAKRLGAKGIGTRPFFYPMHKQPVFNKMGLFKDEHYPVAENLAERGFYIPSGLALNNEQIENVAKAVRSLF